MYISDSSFGNGDTTFPLPPRSKNSTRNRTNIGWKHGTDISGNKKKWNVITV